MEVHNEWLSRFGELSDDEMNSKGLYSGTQKVYFGDFREMIKQIISHYRERVLSGNTRGDWDVDFKEAFEMEIKDYEESMVPYVWYAAYGSNLNSARFQRYLDHCGGDVATIESRPHTINGTIYFAADSNTWGRGKGVAFYDENGQGSVLARVYKVSRSQFIAICDMEGSKYSRTLRLGTIDDVPVYTCTSPQKREDVHAPSTGYVKTILDRLKETYSDHSENMLLSYLFRHGAISEEAREVLAYIRRAPHAVTIREMAESGVCSGIARTEEEVKFLSGLGLIKQDARSIRTGHHSGDPEAMYFTAPEKRDIADLLVYGVI